MTIDALFVLKALISIGIVVALSLIAERLGPRAAGLLTGLPLGAGMVTIFTGLEQGTMFAARAALFMVPGFITTLVFIYFYAQVAARQNRGGVKAVLMPWMAANVTYAISAAFIHYLEMPLEVSIPIIIVSLLLVSKMMSGLPDTPIMARVSFGWRVMAFRAGLATAVILLITGIASTVGAEWIGILTGYPITMLPLILVIHITYSGAETAAVLKHLPMGLGGVVSFCIACNFSLSAYGLGWGLTLAYVAAFSYLLIYSNLSRWWRGRRPA